MKSTVDSYTRAWRELTRCARRRQTVKYGELARRIGYKGPRPVNIPLGDIYYFCQARRLPRITSLVVSASSGRPSWGFGAYSDAKLKRVQEDAMDHEWSKVDYFHRYREHAPHGRPGADESDLQETLDDEGAFDVSGLDDARDKTLRAIVCRRGQPDFRKRLLRAYEGRCAITDCEAREALEAAHIHPYRGPDTNHVRNGLLLRADIHSLFDLHLIRIHPKRRCVVVAPELRGTSYRSLHEEPVRSPKPPDLRPTDEVLAWRWADGE